MIEREAAGRGSGSVARMCRVVGLARSMHYRLRARRGVRVDRDPEARRAVRRVAREMPAYGCRRMTIHLQREEGLEVGRVA